MSDNLIVSLLAVFLFLAGFVSGISIGSPAASVDAGYNRHWVCGHNVVVRYDKGTFVSRPECVAK